MTQMIFFPFHDIYSDLVRTALGLKDGRSIDKFFNEAGINVRSIRGKKSVICEGLLFVTKPEPNAFKRRKN